MTKMVIVVVGKTVARPTLPNKRPRLLSYLRETLKKSTAYRIISAKTELQLYLKDEEAIESSLTFWKKKSQVHPRLGIFAKELLYAPATTANIALNTVWYWAHDGFEYLTIILSDHCCKINRGLLDLFCDCKGPREGYLWNKALLSRKSVTQNCECSEKRTSCVLSKK